MTILRTLTITAKKPHRCDYCSQLVEPKITYTRTSIANEGNIYEWVSHLHCDAIVEKLNMFELNDNEGISSDDYHEHIVQEYCRINKNYNQALPNKPKIDFAEILTMVCTYHGIELNQPYK